MHSTKLGRARLVCVCVLLCVNRRIRGLLFRLSHFHLSPHGCPLEARGGSHFTVNLNLIHKYHSNKQHSYSPVFQCLGCKELFKLIMMMTMVSKLIQQLTGSTSSSISRGINVQVSDPQDVILSEDSAPLQSFNIAEIKSFMV